MIRVGSQRLQTQGLLDKTFASPADVVAWMGAVQSQDYVAAKWALGTRMHTTTAEDIEAAFNTGEIIRTHILRPTWHFVHPKDIRWMLMLTSPRVHGFNGYYYRKSGLDKTVFQKSNDIIRKALVGGKQLTRTELNELLIQAKIPTDTLGLSFTILQAELDGSICSGPRKGKPFGSAQGKPFGSTQGRHFTYMLLDERVPQTEEKTYDEALAELTKRYFQSHGPAQIADFTWWSSLTVADAKKGIALAGLEKEISNGKTYWYIRGIAKKSQESAYLLPPFDEYFVAYKDRSDILDERYKKHMNFCGGMINGAVVVKGIIIGTWKRVLKKETVLITLYPFTRFTDDELEAIQKAAEDYGRFLTLSVTVQVTS